MTVAYRKLTSLNPDAYTRLTVSEAESRYMDYLQSVKNWIKAKSFREWLGTEI